MLSIIATYAAPVPHHGRELTAGWLAYMNQGLQTGAVYAGTGASGEGSFDDLNAQTADAFSALNHQGEPAAVTASPSTASTSTAASPTSTIGTDVTSAVATPIVSSTDAFTAGILSVVDSLTAALGSPTASSAAPASDAAPASTAAPASPSSSGAASAPHFAGWQAYMNQGIATGLQYANAGAGVAAGTTDPATGFNDLNAETADSFNALNHGAQVQDEEAGGQRRHLTAGWRAYMNQGIATGGAYAGTGASGESSFDDLNTQTADAFDKLNHQGETGDVATPAASAQGQQHQHYQPKSALGAAVGRLSASLSTGIVGMVNGGVLSAATAAADTAETLAPAQAAAPEATEAAPATVAAAATGATGDGLITAQAAAAPPAVENEWGR